MTRAIIDWRGPVNPCTSLCAEQFHYILDEYGLGDVDEVDLFGRICSRYAGHLKTIHHKVKRYFTSIFGLHGVAEQFSKKDAKWLLAIVNNRTNKPGAKLDLGSMEEILLWVALRYDFWLGQQLYG